MGKKEQDIATVEVVFILDRSGSMQGLESDTIGGFNSTLKKQKQEPGEVIWSTVLFDHKNDVIHDRVPIQEVSELTEEEYYVRGRTALLDAIGRAVQHIGNVHKYARPEDVPDKTLFIITTDGMENASREYSYDKVKEMIERQTNKYGWEFIFLGANFDAVNVAGKIGIRPERAARFINDSEGIELNSWVMNESIQKMKFNLRLDEDELRHIKADYERRSKK